jgi:hypothetical protein
MVQEQIRAGVAEEAAVAAVAATLPAYPLIDVPMLLAGEQQQQAAHAGEGGAAVWEDEVEDEGEDEGY